MKEAHMTVTVAESLQMVASFTLYVVSALAFVLTIAGMAMIGIALYSAVDFARAYHVPRTLHLSRLLHITRG
jgi:hypothetical protein